MAATSSALRSLDLYKTIVKLAAKRVTLSQPRLINSMLLIKPCSIRMHGTCFAQTWITKLLDICVVIILEDSLDNYLSSGWYWPWPRRNPQFHVGLSVIDVSWKAEMLQTILQMAVAINTRDGNWASDLLLWQSPWVFNWDTFCLAVWGVETAYRFPRGFGREGQRVYWQPMSTFEAISLWHQ